MKSILMAILCLIAVFVITSALPVPNEDVIYPSAILSDDFSNGSPLFQDLLNVAEQRRFLFYPYRRLVKPYEFPALP
ncbi:hypothetical protein Trydic_g6136 [Trypoxylus dichotomus]